MPTSSDELPVQRPHEALARVHAPAGKQPVRPAVLLVPAEQDPPAPAQDRRHADPGLGAHQASARLEEPNPRTPRSVAGSSSTSAVSTGANGTTTSWAIRMPGSTTNGAAGVGVEQDHTHLAAVAGVDQAGRVQHRHPVLGRQPRARLDEAGVPLGDRDREPRADDCPLARPDLRALARDEVEPGIARIGALGHDRVLVQALEEQLGHRRASCDAPSSSSTRNAANRRRSAWLRRARTKTPSSRSIRSSTGAPSS